MRGGVKNELKTASAVNINANSSADVSLNVAMTGYTPIFATIATTGNPNVVPLAAYVTGANTVGATLRNLLNAQQSATALFQVLYKKD